MSYSTYSVKSSTHLLDLWSGVVEELLPDRSSVDEIEGKLPTLKLKTCFKWKGVTPSGILRLEILLFSGFELTSTPPQLLNSPEDMAEMQHSFYNNKLWFIFANISTVCPVCVQYVVRSTFVISSLRPAYAKVYPAGRVDLSAEVFFHAKEESGLLESITEDDLITWFGKNRTTSEDLFSLFSANCNVEVLSPPTTSTPTTERPKESSQKLEVLSVATYTINVDNDSISDDLNDSKSSVESSSAATTDSNEILQEDSEDILSKDNQTTFDTIDTTAQYDITTHIIDQDLAINKNVSPPKHINTIIHNLPARYFKKEPSNSEENSITFAPEIKNDQYVLLDKEELWGMLKEVVNDQLRKKTNQKSLGFT